jgi:hypothetical protein
MSLEIQEVLNRRGDLSTFLVHLTRDRNGLSAASALESVIRERRLRALSPMGWAKTEDDPAEPAHQSQRVVCFSETPLEHVYSLFADIAGRQVCLKPYGLALTKVVARMEGINPVWYVDMTTRGGRDWEEARAIDAIRDAAVAARGFHDSPEAKLFPFFEHMGTWPDNRKEFWWEREWRHRGDIDLADRWGSIIWLCPEEEHPRFRRCIEEAAPPGHSAPPVVLDPSWGLEQIIGHLCGLPAEDVSLFHASVRNGTGPAPLDEALAKRLP